MFQLIWQLLLLLDGVSTQSTWTKLPVHSPQYLLPDRPDMPYFWWHYAKIHVGDPPQAQELAIHLRLNMTFLYGPSCVYCPYYNTYQPSLSSTFRTEGKTFGASTFMGSYASELIRFGGLTVPESPIGLVKHILGEFLPLNRPREGFLGLSTHPINASTQGGSVFDRLQQSGQLLNPVIGIKLGGLDPSLSIGAFDPRDYEGEINWVQASPFGNEIGIPIEAIRGYKGTVLSLPYPVFANLDSTIPDIILPGILDFLANKALLGPDATLWQDPGQPYRKYHLKCAVDFNTMDFSGINLPFSVDINGVNYPVESQDLIRPENPSHGECEAAFRNTSSLSSGPPITLGLPFLRSIYLAYRFPTADCPYAHYGFAFSKGLNRTAQTLSQTSRTKPEHSSQCLQLISPTTEPSSNDISPIVKPGQELLQTSRPDGKTWKVYNSPDQWVMLRGVDDLPDMVERRLAFRN